MDIVHSVDIQTTPDRLYDAITTQEGLAGWWTAETKSEPRVGALNEFRFGPDATLTFRVETLQPERRVAWSGVEVPPDWKGTQIIFDTTPNGDSVNLRFSQTGFAPDYEQFGFFNYRWGQYVRSLKLLLETGQGEPFGSAAAKDGR